MVVEAIPAGEMPGWGLGKVEEVLGKVLARGIKVWWPEEGDRRKGATAAREHERSSSLVDVRRRKEDMTGGSHKEVIYLDVNWADRPPLPSGPSAVFLGVTPPTFGLLFHLYESLSSYFSLLFDNGLQQLSQRMRDSHSVPRSRRGGQEI